MRYIVYQECKSCERGQRYLKTGEGCHGEIGKVQGKKTCRRRKESGVAVIEKETPVR